jgi:hypothetical protein
MLANVIQFPGAPVPRTRLADLLGRFEAIEAQENPDLDVPLSALRATDVGTVEIPDLGAHVLTDWSRNQLGHALGISWDRFFAGAPHDVAAEDLNRRLGRAHGVVRLRTNRVAPEGLACQGTIRAVVSRDFATVRDTAVVAMLQDALAQTEPDARIVRTAQTDLSTSFVLRLGEPYRLGGPGRVGDVWGGLLVRNSGVGYSRLVVSLHLVRLVCMNGMACPIPMPALVRHRHRWIEEREIREAITGGLQGIGERLRRGAYVLEEAGHHRVEDIEAEVRHVLRAAKLPTSLVRPVLSAYSREPHASRFGISQALTLAAQQTSPETRLQLEELAGSYLTTPR